MARPRHNQSVRFPPEMLAALHQAATDRDLSINFLVNKAVEDFLDRLLPSSEVKWTSDTTEVTHG